MVLAGYEDGKAQYNASTGEQCEGCCCTAGELFTIGQPGVGTKIRLYSHDAAGNQTCTFIKNTTNWNIVRVNNGVVYVQQSVLINRYDYFGSLLSSFNFGGTVFDLDADSSGNIYIGVAGNQVNKYNSSDVLQWTVNTFADTPAGVRYDPNSTNTSVGLSRTTGPFYAIRNYDSIGGFNWGSSITVNANMSISGVAIDSSGNIYGVANAGYSPPDYFACVKFDSSGTEQWKNFADSVGSPTSANTGGSGARCAVDETNSLLVASGMISYNNVNQLIAYNISDGTIAWQVNGTFIDVTTDISGNNYALKTNGEVTKRNGSGVLQWTKNLTALVTAVSLDFER